MQAVLAIEFLIQVSGLCDSVSIKIYSITRLKNKFVLTIAYSLHSCEHKAGATLEIFECSVRMLDQRMIVSGIRKEYLTVPYIQNTHPRSDEHSCIVTFAKLLVGKSEDLLDAHS